MAAISEMGAVAFFGKVGAGKTNLLNNLCGTRYPSQAQAESCTRCSQDGCSKKNRIVIIDSAGLEAKQEVAKHLAIQKVALETHPLSAVCVVVKADRPDAMDKPVIAIMDAIGDENEDLVRVIVTHADVERQKDGFNERDYKEMLAENVGIRSEHVFFVGKDDEISKADDWLRSVLVPARQLTIDDSQMAGIAALSTAVRKYDRPISQCIQKIEAAKKTCVEVAIEKNEVSDELVAALQASVHDMVMEDKEAIFRRAEAESLETNVQHLVYGRAGVWLSIKLKKFIEETNKLLSWDVSDPTDPRNSYKQCECNAVYVKTEGCDGTTTCGAVPSAMIASKPSLTFQYRQNGDKYQVDVFVNGVAQAMMSILSCLRHFRNSQSRTVGGVRTRPAGSVIEGGCGRTINWSTMRPITAEQMEIMRTWGQVELVKAEVAEKKFEHKWASDIRREEEDAKKQLLDSASRR